MHHTQIQGCAAVLTETGNIYTGVNIENVSLVQLIVLKGRQYSVISNGERKLGPLHSSDSEEIVFPCGICRQVILEFGNKIQNNM